MNDQVFTEAHQRQLVATFKICFNLNFEGSETTFCPKANVQLQMIFDGELNY